MSDREAAFIGQIPLLLESVEAAQGDPGHDVLHRPVYIDDDAADAELGELIFDDVETQRAADRSLVARWSEKRFALTLDEAHGVLRALNEARLVLAARAGAFQEGPSWEDRIEQEPALAAVAWLGFVQSELLRVLARG